MAPKKGSSKSSGGVDPMVLGAAGALAFACVAMLALTGEEAAAPAPPPAGAVVEAGKVVALTVEDDLKLLNAQVFSGDDTWLVWCSDSTTPTPDGTDPAAIVAELAPLMSGIANVGSMDCSGELPSGKSVYDKLDLDDEAPDEEHPLGAPVMFVKAPGSKPQQLPVAKIKTKAIGSILNKVSLPKLQFLEGEKDMQKHCLSKQYCMLILQRGEEPLSEPHATELKEIMNQPGLRKAAFCATDASQYRLTTSPKILKKGELTKEVPFALLFNRNGNRVSAQIDRSGNFSAAGSAAEMLKTAMNGGVLPIVLKDMPKLVDKDAKKNAERDARAAEKAELEAEAAAKVAAAEQEAAKRAAEKARREQMDEEAKNADGIQEDDGEEAEDDEEEEEAEGNEEEVDMDDSE